MAKSIRLVDIVILLASLLVLGVTVFAQMSMLQVDTLTTDENVIWHLIGVTGLVGYLALAGSMIWGLWLSTGMAKNWSPGAATNSIHVTLSWLAVAFSLLHVVLLLVDDYFTYSILDIVIPFRGTYEPFAVGVGIIAMWMTLLVNLSFQVRKWMGRTAWKLLHLTSYFIFGMVTYHMLAAGTDQNLWGLRLMTATLCGGVVLFLSIRVVKLRRL